MKQTGVKKKQGLVGLSVMGVGEMKVMGLSK